MNTSACIIAACATNARTRRKREENANSSAEELRYKVTLRKYYYFEPATIMGKWLGTQYPVLNDEVIPVIAITPITVDAKTYGLASSFSVKESLCANGIDAYIRENLERITSTNEWKDMHVQVLNDYCADIKLCHGIDIDPAGLNYTTEYYWEVK